MNEQNPVQTSNGRSSNAINWTTIALIVLSGGSNFLETKAGNNFNAEEIRKATQEIHELYPKLMQALNNQKGMIESNSEQLDNQLKILRYQQQILDGLKKSPER